MPAMHPAFQCVVTSPSGRLIDCMATSVVFPAHDGEVGILYNHIPMLCELGMGIMKITGVPPDIDTSPSETFLFIDGGFALLAANVLAITAFEAISPRDTESARMEQIIERAERTAAEAAISQQRSYYLRKISLLKRLTISI